MDILSVKKSEEVIINDDFAKENSFPGRSTSITVKVATGDKKRIEAKSIICKLLIEMVWVMIYGAMVLKQYSRMRKNPSIPHK